MRRDFFERLSSSFRIEFKDRLHSAICKSQRETLVFDYLSGELLRIIELDETVTNQSTIELLIGLAVGSKPNTCFHLGLGIPADIKRAAKKARSSVQNR